MLRVTIVLLLAIATIEPALSADRSVARRSWHRAAIMLPAGLPRPHYKFRTTISYDAQYVSRRAYAPRVFAHGPEALLRPVYPEIGYVPVVIGAPLLPALSTLPGYYGSPSYDYLGPYYGGPYVNYWDRLPYACGVYGYC